MGDRSIVLILLDAYRTTSLAQSQAANATRRLSAPTMSAACIIHLAFQQVSQAESHVRALDHLSDVSL